MKTLFDSDIVVIGHGKSVSGDANNNGQTDNGDLRPFFIKSGKANFYDLTITKSTAKGGDGGGGGAAMGGGMFIYDGNVSLSNVNFSNNRAQGCSSNPSLGGGGGGMFGNGTISGGGLFASATTSDGGYGGNGNYRSNDTLFGEGGFGGGFGSRGYGGGFGGRGGGAGMGGGIFMRSGRLTLNSVNLNNNSASGGSGTENGQGLGGALFIMKRTTNTNDNNQFPARY